jgi:hypothetical protein
MGAAQALWSPGDSDCQCTHPAAPIAEFTTGESCWWLRTSSDPATWPILLVDAAGVGWQRLETTTTAFLTQWARGLLDLPVLSHAAVPRPLTLVPAGGPVPALRLPAANRDPGGLLLCTPGESQAIWCTIKRRLGAS